MLSRNSTELLEEAKHVVNSVMKTKGARLLFNKPVDPVELNLHDYYDVIERPIDLGTIYNRLVEGQKSGWTQTHYRNPIEVLKDVQLVWTNCYSFNKGENDEPVREICRKTEEHFNMKWKRAQLPIKEDHGEEEIPNKFSLIRRSVDLPIRFLDEFSVFSVPSRTFFPLAEIKHSNISCIYVTGNLLMVSESGAISTKEPFTVYLDQILDWCCQYGDNPGFWMITSNAWYKLLKPAEAYVPYLAKTILHFMMTVAKLNFGINEIPTSFKKGQNGQAEGRHVEEDGMLTDDIVEMLMENDSVKDGTLTLIRKRSRSPTSHLIDKKKCSRGEEWLDTSTLTNNNSKEVHFEEGEENGMHPFVMDLDLSGTSTDNSDNSLCVRIRNVSTQSKGRNKETGDFEERKCQRQRDSGQLSEEQNGISTRQNHRRKKLEKKSLKVKLGNRSKAKVSNVNEVASAALSDFEDEDYDPLFDPSIDMDSFTKDDEDEDYTSEHKKMKGKKSGESDNQKVKREKKALEALKMDKAADRKRGNPPMMKTDFNLPQEFIGLALSCWDFFMTFRLILELPQFSFWRFEAAISPIKTFKKTPTSSSSSIDKYHDHKSGKFLSDKRYFSETESSASALLLHDIHTSLVKVLQGKIQLTKQTPTNASLESIKPNSGHWTQNVSLLLLKSPIVDVDDETRKIATFLHGHEYLDLPVAARLKILHTLINMVLALEAFHEHLNSLLDKQSVQKGRPCDGQAFDVEILESIDLSLDQKAVELSVLKWNRWFSTYRLGAMNSIGQDFRGAQYWILGGSSGCYRIYVEQRLTYARQCVHEGIEKEPLNFTKVKGKAKNETGLMIWGYLEGESIKRLVDWLMAGDLDSEKTLLDALQNIPNPVRIETQHHKPYSEEEEEEEDLIAHKAMNIVSIGYSNLNPMILEQYQVDEYRDIQYPLLRGEGELIGLISEIHLSQRITSCIRSLLASIPFWEKEANVRSKICAIVERMMMPHGTLNLAQEVIQAGELIQQAGVVHEGWNSFHKEWKKSLTNATSLNKILSHLFVLQSYVLLPSNSIHRVAFNGMIHDARCPLYFPLPGESIVVLKTGCLAHLDRYLDISKRAFEAPSTAENFKKSLHLHHITLAKKQAEALNPIERFQVTCIAYRSPYTDLLLDGSAFAEDNGIPLLACMWMLLTPPDGQLRQMNHILSATSLTNCIALPIHVDSALPDFIVKVGAFDQSIQKNWKVGDRFKMFFGGKSTARSQAGGGYYKGTISQVALPSPGESYDPWESLTVEWDNDNTGASMKVSPWEIEVDPEEQRKLEEAQIRQMESQARYSRALGKQQRSEYYSEMMDGDDDGRSVTDPDYDPLIDCDGDRQSNRTRKRGSALDELVYYDPKNPSGPVPPEMMRLIPGPRGFPILIHNFMQRLKGKFKCPVFSGKDLDLFKVFHEVQNRGGYDRVTNLKLWKEVCRTLNVNLTGQTSASYNMRLNYEKCLLDFEHYLSSGTYRQEIESGTAPSSTDLEPFPLKLRNEMVATTTTTNSPIPSVTSMVTPLVASGHTSEELDVQMMTRGAKRNKAATNLSMTQLLMGGDAYPPDFSSLIMGQQNPTSAPIGDPLLDEKRFDWARLISPYGDKGPAYVKGKSSLGWIETPSSLPVVVLDASLCCIDSSKGLLMGSRNEWSAEMQAEENTGTMMDRMGWALCGTTLWRRWPGIGQWYKAEVTDYNSQRHEFCLMTDKGTEQESTEWIDLRELGGEEISQQDPEGLDVMTSGNVLPSLKTGGNSTATTGQQDLSNLFAAPPALHRYGMDSLSSENRSHIDRPSNAVLSSSAAALGLESQASVNPMDLISQVLSSGVSPEVFKQLVDNAAENRNQAQLHQYASLRNPSSLLMNSSGGGGQIPSSSSTSLIGELDFRPAPQTPESQDIHPELGSGFPQNLRK